MGVIHDLLAHALEWVESLGYWGIIIGLAIEVIPSEIVLGFGGYLVSKGDVTFLGAVICGTIGAVIQQWLLYAIGKYGGRPFLLKFGKYLHIKEKHVDIAEKWFDKYGPVIVFTARFVPVMRQVISIPAGMARMNFTVYTLLTLLASIPWSFLFVWLGWKLGDNWEQIGEEAAPYTHIIIPVAAALLVIYFLYAIWRSKKKKTA
ncbi:DedA family protein [Cohnella sp. CFH 77786]|uniref:DedA family protein n=1 Tax=Cohnella sp. CFH 77786 TaxID=2662265 RepID=UPI001C60C66F|nr:DedA family protein [Cohnella sp. CFH 77786]MBW5449409.1 DedA family protein [Cohnella sp. CFH 77786]